LLDLDLFGQDHCFKQPAIAPMPLRSAKSGKARALAEVEPDSDAPHPAGLDRYDVAILAALQADARLSNADLAARIGLSAAPTWRR
jgi:Lrp/AsnC family transcriptional regulator, leucine-responsive regulatory protein